MWEFAMYIGYKGTLVIMCTGFKETLIIKYCNNNSSRSNCVPNSIQCSGYQIVLWLCRIFPNHSLSVMVMSESCDLLVEYCQSLLQQCD
jgi:hypothetical protein